MKTGLVVSGRVGSAAAAERCDVPHSAGVISGFGSKLRL